MAEINDRIINKIKAFLKLAQSPYKEEAENALNKAHEMLKEYNLSMSDIDLNESAIIDEEISDNLNRIRHWKDLLYKIIAKVNYCRIFKLFGRKDMSRSNLRSNFTLRIIGRKHNVIGTQIMIDYIFSTIERLSINVERKEKESYKLGIATTIYNRLMGTIKKEVNDGLTTGLILRENGLINKWWDENYQPYKQAETPISIRAQSAYDQGLADGHLINLNQHIDHKNESNKPNLLS
jgi:hypothetical protein